MPIKENSLYFILQSFEKCKCSSFIFGTPRQKLFSGNYHITTRTSILFLLNKKRLKSFLNQHSTWFYFLTDFKVQTENKLTLASKVYHLLKFCELDQIFLLGGSEISWIELNQAGRSGMESFLPLRFIVFSLQQEIEGLWHHAKVWCEYLLASYLVTCSLDFFGEWVAE